MAEHFAAENKIRPSIEYPHQVPEFRHLRLDRCRGAQQQVLRTRTDAEHEGEQVVGLSSLFAQCPSAPGLVRFVEYDRPKLPLQEETPFVGVVDDQAS